jgi:DNA-binding transcriptional regulator YiaG
MKTTSKNQAALLRAARRALDLTNRQLANALGKSEPTLMAWLSPAAAAKHRTMPAGSRLLLDRLLKDHRPTPSRRSAKKK